MGGAEQIVISLSRGAQARGHEVAVAAAPGPLGDDLAVEQFRLPLVRRSPWRIPGATFALRHAVRAWRPEVVHAHNPGMALAAGLATRRGRRPPGLVSVHGVPEKDWPAAARLVRASGLEPVACGPGVAAALVEHSVPPVATIANAVGPAPPPAERAALERDFGLALGTPLVVAVGRLVEAKNHALPIRALAGVPDAVLVIVGEGPLRAKLEREASAAGVAGRVVLAGLRPDARALMGAADAVVLSSWAEGLPLVALEALAAGTPLVATAVRGVRELVEDGRNALLVPPDDPQAMAAALRRVLGDAQLSARLAEEGPRVPGAGSQEPMIAAYLAFYERLLA